MQAELSGVTHRPTVNSTMNDEEKPKPLSRLRRIAYGTGHFYCVLAIAAMWFPYGISFFTKVLGLPAKSAGNIVLIGQIGGAISTPFVGHWSDQCVCRVPGRRKIFQLIGVLFLASSFFFLWHECFGCAGATPNYKVLYYGSFAVIVQFGWASGQVGQLALMPELSTDKSIQVELSSIRNAFTLIGNVIVFGCFWGLLEHLNHDIDATHLSSKNKDIFWIMALVVLAIGVPVSLLVFQIFVPERDHMKRPQLPWYKWLAKPKFYLTALCFMSAKIIVFLPQSYLPLYFMDTLKMDRTSIAKGPLILYISSFVFTLIVKRVQKTIGENMTFFIGLVFVWGALIWIWVKDPTDDPHSSFNWSRDSIYGAIVLLGAGGAIVLVITLAMIPYLIEGYTGSSAFVTGWIQFGDRLSNGVAVKIIQQFSPNPHIRDSKVLADFYRHVVVFTPFVATGVGLLTLLVMVGVNCYSQRQIKKPSTHSKRNERPNDEATAIQRQLTDSTDYGSMSI